MGTGPNKARGPGALRARPRSTSTAHLLSQEGTEGTSSNMAHDCGTSGQAPRIQGCQRAWAQPASWAPGPAGLPGGSCRLLPVPGLAATPQLAQKPVRWGGQPAGHSEPGRCGGPDREELIVRSRAGLAVGSVDGLRLRRRGGSLRWLCVMTR